MLANIARSAARTRVVFQRHATTAVQASSNTREFDVTGKSEEEMEKEIQGLEIPAGLPLINETADGFEVTTTKSIAEFRDSLHNYAVYNEGLADPERSPYQEALGIDYRKKLALGSYFVLTALSKEWYIMNEETVIAACFGGFVTSMYVLLAGPMTDWYNGVKDKEIREQNEAEDAHVAACQNILNGFPADAIQNDLDAVFAEEKQAIESEARAKVIQEKNDLINSYEKNLNKMVITKQEETNKAYQLLLNDTVASVRDSAGKAAFKKEALQYALDAAVGKDVAATNPTVALYDKLFKDLSGKK